MDNSKLVKLIAAILACEFVGVLGAMLTITSITTWYPTLQKPSFSPPNWLFGPVWTLLYALMGISAYLIWDKGIKKKGVKPALKLFSLQLILNFMWSILFFGFKSPLLGLMEIAVLWIAVLATIMVFARLSRKAAVLMVPYILWVSFAAVLNLYVWMLNPML
jgi:benzodiazapine receptor